MGIFDTVTAYTQVLGGKKNGPGAPPPGPKAPKFAQRNTQDFIPKEAAVQIGGPSGSSSLDRRYNALKEQVKNQGATAVQGANDQIQRKFSAMGASGSGAELKLLQEAQDNAQKQTNDAMLGVEAQYQGELSNRDLQQADMDFKQRVFNFDRGSKMHELDLSERQQQIDSVNTDFNKQMAQYMAQPPKQGLLSNMLGGIL